MKPLKRSGNDGGSAGLFGLLDPSVIRLHIASLLRFKEDQSIGFRFFSRLR
jgi:hypothetical protein